VCSQNVYISSHQIKLFFVYYLTYYNVIFLNLSELAITDTEEKLIAVAAITGESSIPKNGYKTPAATVTPKAFIDKNKNEINLWLIYCDIIFSQKNKGKHQ